MIEAFFGIKVFTFSGKGIKTSFRFKVFTQLSTGSDYGAKAICWSPPIRQNYALSLE
jgi:hypothetical protein